MLQSRRCHSLLNHATVINYVRSISSCVKIQQQSSESPEPSVQHQLDDVTKLRLANRHSGIILSPVSLSQSVLPYDQILKTNSKTGTVRLMDVERSLGYFWTLTDLKRTNNKPILSNDKLISSEDAKPFPFLGRTSGKIIQIIDKPDSDPITLPQFFTRMNRSKDPAIECSLVSISFNDFGYRMVPEWTDPFRQAFSTRTDWTHRAKVFQLVVHEGRILSFLQSFIARSFRKQTVAEFHPSLLLYFTKGDDEEYQSFRDVLRMHNNKTAYVFLLDGVGKVRFAGSGRPSPEEIHRLIELAKSMVPALK